MSKSRLNKPLESGADYIAYCHKHPALLGEHVAGSHHTFSGPSGRITLCDHRRELAPWLRVKIWRELIAIGLGILVVAILILPVVA